MYLTLSTAVSVIVFISIDRVQIVSHFLEIILHTFGCLFLPLDDWQTSENLSTETFPYHWWPWVWAFWWRGQL